MTDSVADDVPAPGRLRHYLARLIYGAAVRVPRLYYAPGYFVATRWAQRVLSQARLARTMRKLDDAGLGGGESE